MDYGKRQQPKNTPAQFDDEKKFYDDAAAAPD
jgi:hypothetical protein